MPEPVPARWFTALVPLLWKSMLQNLHFRSLFFGLESTIVICVLQAGFEECNNCTLIFYWNFQNISFSTHNSSVNVDFLCLSRACSAILQMTLILLWHFLVLHSTPSLPSDTALQCCSTATCSGPYFPRKIWIYKGITMVFHLPCFCTSLKV